MAEPEPAASLLHYVLAAATAIGTAIGAIFATVKLHRRRQNGTVSPADLERLHRRIQEEAKRERHDNIYPTMTKMVAENQEVILRIDREMTLEFQRVQGTINEALGNLLTRLGKLETNVAVLRDRSDRQQPE